MYSVNLYIFFWHVACVPLKHTKYRSWEYFFCASDLGAQQISPLASLLLWFSALNRISQGPSFNGDVRMWRVGGLMSCVHLRWSLGLTMSWIMHGPCSDKKQTCTNDHMSEYMSYAAMLITLSEKPIYLHAFGWLQQSFSGKCSSWDVPAELVRRESKASTNFLAESLLQNRSRYIKTAGAQNSQESSNLKTNEFKMTHKTIFTLQQYEANWDKDNWDGWGSCS